MKHGRSALTLAFILVTAGLLWSSGQLSASSGWIAQAVLTGTLLLLLWQLAVEQLPLRWSQRFESAKLQAENSTVQTPNPNGFMLPALAWIAALPLATWLLGIPIGSSLFCLAWLRWQSQERWIFSLIFALVIGVGVQLLFGILLNAELGLGVVFN